MAMEEKKNQHRAMDPITFEPLYMQRVWGGRELEQCYQRKLPDTDSPYGESWEICDREDEQSIVNSGVFSGQSLQQLWCERREEVFGTGFEKTDRFPLLIKILDAQDDLSIQVHPPKEIAKQLDGEPKTEMWYIAHAKPGAKLYVGVREGITKEAFRQAIEEGTVEQCVHALEPQQGDFIFIPSGRLHAIGAGLVIYEIQQNSDTTYRVFDWNRMGLDGKPRDLHVEESLKCIDFQDTHPAMDQPDGNTLATCKYFHVDQLKFKAGTSVGNPNPERFSIVTVVQGLLTSSDERRFCPGDFILLPRSSTPLTCLEDTVLLQTTVPN